MLPTGSPEAIKMLNGNPSLRYRRRLKSGFLVLILVALLGFVTFRNKLPPKLRENWSLLPAGGILPHYREKIWDGEHIILINTMNVSN